MPPERTQRLWRALGFPDPADEEALFTDADVGALGTLSALIDSGFVGPETEATREVTFDFQPVDNTPLSFATDILPIHVARCAKCHEGGPGHDLSTYDSWKLEAARISQAIRDRRMPADGPLDPSQATLIQRWAQSGANP